MHADRLVKRRRATRLPALDAREPALINLPVPIPSDIPIISPILDPLVAGLPSSDLANPPPLASIPPLISLPIPTPQATPAPNPLPSSPAPPTTANSPSEPSAPQPQPSQPAPQQTPAPSTSGNGGGNQGAPANSSGNGNDSGNSVGDSASPPGSSLVSSPPAETSASQGVSRPVNAISGSTSASGQGSFSSQSTSAVLDGLGTAQSLTLPSGQAVPVQTQKVVANAGSNPPTGTEDIFDSGSSTVTLPASGSLATGPSAPHSGNSGSGGNDGQGGAGAGNTGASGSTHGLSEAAIVVLSIIGSLLVIALVVFGCRRRATSRRLGRRKRRFGGRKLLYGAVSSSDYFRQNLTSPRSSFRTSFEHGTDPFSTTPPPVPPTLGWPLPDTEQMTQASNVPVALPTAAATTHSLPSLTLRNGDRSSIGSYDSTASQPSFVDSSTSSSSHSGQMLIVPERTADGEPWTPDVSTPISVRPFSPSERWSFPKPPTTIARNTALLQPPPRTKYTSPESAATSDYVTAPESENPFADSAAVDSIDDHTTETLVTADTDAAAHFSSIETVCRPFLPARRDEIVVEPGDQVHVVKRFNDGWVYAQNRTRGIRGLFPIDCLRMPDQDINTFLAEKRLSAYVAVHSPSEAVVRLNRAPKYKPV